MQRFWKDRFRFVSFRSNILAIELDTYISLSRGALDVIVYLEQIISIFFVTETKHNTPQSINKPINQQTKQPKPKNNKNQSNN